MKVCTDVVTRTQTVTPTDKYSEIALGLEYSVGIQNEQRFHHNKQQFNLENNEPKLFENMSNEVGVILQRPHVQYNEQVADQQLIDQLVHFSIHEPFFCTLLTSWLGYLIPPKSLPVTILCLF